MDCAEYFLNEMNKLIGKDYVPTFSDVCHCRYRTSGIKTESFVCDNAQITITDGMYYQFIDHDVSHLFSCHHIG